MSTPPRNPLRNQPVPPGPKKSVAPSRMDDVQKRAQAMANRKPVDPATFLQETWRELKLTKWPDQSTLTKATTVVLALVLAVAVWVGGLDAILSKVMNPLFSGTH